MDKMGPNEEDNEVSSADKTDDHLLISQLGQSPRDESEHDLTTLIDNLNMRELDQSEPFLPIIVYPGLEEYECHFNWVNSTTEKLTKSLAQTIINVLNDKLSENTHDGEASLKYLAIECVSFRAALAFLSTLIERHIDAQRHLNEAFQDINTIRNNGYVAEEYLSGLRYVLQGLNVFHNLQSRQSEFNELEPVTLMSMEEIRPHTSGLGDFKSLGPKSQAAVLAVRHYFYGSLRKNSEEQFKLLERMIQLDDDSYLWHFRLHNQHRFFRREQNSRCHSPTAEEVKEIIKAVEMEPEHPFVLVMDCLCLAETMKSYGAHGSWRLRMMYGNKEYTSTQSVVDYIKVQTAKILEKHSETVRINVHIAEFFSSLLPHDYRDMAFAKECLERALLFHPNSSKAHHKMGTFLLHSAENLNEAIIHFERSLECDSRNFPAKADLLKCYMSDPHENYAKISEMLQVELLNPKWNCSRKGSLHFLNGCFLLLTSDLLPENEIEAALAWLNACEMSRDSLDFKSISYITKRYKWTRGKLSIRGVTKAINELAESGKVDPFNEILSILRKLIKLCQDEASIKLNHKHSRGGRNGVNFSRGSRENVNFHRRGSTSSVSSMTDETTSDKVNPAKPYSRGPRRFSSSAAVDENGMKVIIERNPFPPSGPGFQRRGRPKSSSESSAQ